MKRQFQILRISAKASFFLLLTALGMGSSQAQNCQTEVWNRIVVDLTDSLHGDLRLYRPWVDSKKERLDQDTAKLIVVFPEQHSRIRNKELNRLKADLQKKGLALGSIPEDSCAIDLARLNQNAKFRFIFEKDFPEGYRLWERPAKLPFAGMVFFSPILFDKTGNFGFLNAGYMCGQLCGRIVDVFIQKVGEEWRIVEIETVGVF